MIEIAKISLICFISGIEFNSHVYVLKKQKNCYRNFVIDSQPIIFQCHLTVTLFIFGEQFILLETPVNHLETVITL